MNDERQNHLEDVAARLTQAYYSVRVEQAPEHRDILETYLFLLKALRDHEGQPEGSMPLQAGDTIARFQD